MTLVEQWLSHCRRQAVEPSDFYHGARKIRTGVMLEFGPLDDSLQLADCGFTRNKLSMLKRLYWDVDHAAQVAELWAGRVERDRYGSVSVSTYHHITKADPTKRSKRASVMGPCLVGVSATLLEDSTVAIDAFYRTSELYKKFPADLIFMRDIVLPALNINPAGIRRLRCHFANITIHPMYWVTTLPLMKDPIRHLERLKPCDERLWLWVVKWTARYLCDEYAHGIQKFAQAMRVSMDARRRVGEATPLMAQMQKYLRDNHPGYRHSRYEKDEEEDD